MMRVLLVFVVCFVCAECGEDQIYDYAPGDGELDDVNGYDCCIPFETAEHHHWEIDQSICTYMVETWCARGGIWCTLGKRKHKCCAYRDRCGMLCECKDPNSRCEYKRLRRELQSLKGVHKHED